MAIYLDNLSFHKSNYMKTVYEELDIKCILSPIYSPDTNCIENCFSKLK